MVKSFLRDASKILGLRYRPIIRLKKRFLSNNIDGIVRKKPPHPPNLKVTDTIREGLINLRKTIDYDFNILYFKDKLSRFHNINLCYEIIIRRILIEEGLHT